MQVTHSVRLLLSCHEFRSYDLRPGATTQFGTMTSLDNTSDDGRQHPHRR
jgi:hypothetical protein